MTCGSPHTNEALSIRYSCCIPKNHRFSNVLEYQFLTRKPVMTPWIWPNNQGILINLLYATDFLVVRNVLVTIEQNNLAIRICVTSQRPSRLFPHKNNVWWFANDFSRDCMTRENHWQMTPPMTKKCYSQKPYCRQSSKNASQLLFVHSCSKVMGFFCGGKIWCLFLRHRLEIFCMA